ncbi:MAG: DNA (cytosine-5-)-methyltransferase [Culicoidibacterales bacterium]
MNKMRVIETFSGIGSQAKALKRIKETDNNFDFEVVATVEWEVGAMYAYDILHNGPQELSKYKHMSRKEIIQKLKNKNISVDGKKPIEYSTLKRMPELQLRMILNSIERNNNLIDISSVKATDLPDADLLTYSFPCQDLSISSYWHGNFTGIDKTANNRSGLLWEIERILYEYKECGKELPKFLLMENVTAIQSPMHKSNFELWQKSLQELGYYNHTFNLNAKNFGVPQSRERTYMISILCDNQDKQEEIEKYLAQDSKLHYQAAENPSISPFLRLNYDEKPIYLQEAHESIPNYTESRRLIHKKNTILAKGLEVQTFIAKTITTKQDRNPNAGIIEHELAVPDEKARYRYLTPRETFLLMGFDEQDFDLLWENNHNISKTRRILSYSKLLKLTGNSIVVNVLEAIFRELIYIDKEYL